MQRDLTLALIPSFGVGLCGRESPGILLNLCPPSPTPTADDWKAVNEDLTISCRYVIKNQTTGSYVNVRVVAMNPGGRSVPAMHPDSVRVKEVGGKS